VTITLAEYQSLRELARYAQTIRTARAKQPIERTIEERAELLRIDPGVTWYPGEGGHTCTGCSRSERHYAAISHGLRPWPQPDIQVRLQRLIVEGATVFICGPAGVGKTQLAIAAAVELGAFHLYARLADLLLAINVHWHELTPSRQSRHMNNLRNVPLLIIDDAHAVSGTKAGETVFDSIVDARYRAMLATVIVSNVQASKLPEVLGRANVDRAHGSVIEMLGKSQRQER
jgi:hypothetical protein